MEGVYDTVALSVKQIRCDISVTSYGVAVFFHDESPRRMTGDARSVLTLTSSELIQIPLLTVHICPSQYIPLAEKRMQSAADQDLFLHLEIKVHDREVQRLINASLDVLTARDQIHRRYISPLFRSMSFN